MLRWTLNAAEQLGVAVCVGTNNVGQDLARCDPGVRPGPRNHWIWPLDMGL